MTAPEQRLDAWIARPAVRSHHRRAARADPERLWRCAQGVRLSDVGTLGHMVRWRLPGVGAETTFSELFRAHPFTLLEEGEQHSISGLCGRIWTLGGEYPSLSGVADFRDWDEPGTVRVLLAHWTSALEDGGAELFSEARVQPVDRAAAVRLRALWTVIGPFERLIGSEPLPVAVRRAEAEEGDGLR